MDHSRVVRTVCITVGGGVTLRLCMPEPCVKQNSQSTPFNESALLVPIRKNNNRRALYLVLFSLIVTILTIFHTKWQIHWRLQCTLSSIPRSGNVYWYSVRCAQNVKKWGVTTTFQECLFRWIRCPDIGLAPESLFEQLLIYFEFCS